MTDIEKKAQWQDTKAKADFWSQRDYDKLKAEFKAAIEQHEAFRQEVSDAVEEHLLMTDESCSSLWRSVARDNISRFIIAKPADPLVEAFASIGMLEPKYSADNLRAALAARGLEIREKQQ